MSEIPETLISDEEKTVVVFLLVAIVIALTAIGLSVALVIQALPGPDHPAEPGQLTVALAALGFTLLAIGFAMFGRWPGQLSSETTIEVSAQPNLVWEAITLRDDYPGWKKVYTGIERLDEPGEVYRLHYADDSSCSRCSLPRDPDRSRWSSRVEILESRAPSLYRQRCFPKGLSARESEMEELLNSEDATMLLEPLSDGGSRVTFSSTVVKPKVWLAFLTKLGRPGREHLRSLKAHLEGTPDESLFGISAKRIEAARQAPRRCTCPL